MKRTFAAILAALLCVSVFAGCNQSTESSSTPESSVGESSATGSANEDGVKSDKEFTLQVVTSGQRDDGIDDVIGMYKEMYPNATVEPIESTWGDGGQDMREKELLLINSGTAPDVMKMVWTKEFAREGLLADITEEVKQLPIYENLSEGQLDRMTYEDTIYSMTFNNNSIYMFYNNDILSEAGWDKAPTTIDEVSQLGKDILDKGLTASNGGTVYLTEFDGGNWDTDYWLWALGGQQMNDDYTECLINSPESVKAYQFMQDLVKQGSVPKMDGTGQQLWLNGQIALYFGGEWDVPPTDEAGLNYGVATTPVGPTGENTVSIGGVEWGVSAESELKQEAVDFISIFVSKEFSKTFGRGTTDLSLYDDPENQQLWKDEGLYEAKMVQKEQLENAKYNFLEAPFIFPDGKTVYANALQRILVNLEDVQTVMDAAAEEINQGIASES